MVGRYPHQDPTAFVRGTPTAAGADAAQPAGSTHAPAALEGGGPSHAEAVAHHARLVAAGVNCFVSLVDETPAQDDDGAWAVRARARPPLACARAGACQP
jgi:hypothetical protein